VPPGDVEEEPVEERDPEELTVAQLRAELDAAGVEYAPGHGKKALVRFVQDLRGA
jgi:hypothetical protein